MNIKTFMHVFQKSKPKSRLNMAYRRIPYQEILPPVVKKRGRPRKNPESPLEQKPVIERFPPRLKKPDEDCEDCPDPLLNSLIEDEVVESIDFMRDKNKLSIKLIKKQNRVFKVQIFLNEELEIRNANYAGMNTATNFWSMLKACLK
ncbi:Uncharacterised protein [uncultured archaeon]|nr:Uncharacterised protein [uncultured archaeon]